MKSDKSRETFHPEKHYSSVRLQQGRVLTDADWNEQSDIIEHRDEVTNIDVIGQSGFPETNGGFSLTPSGTTDLFISPGRGYVDGLLVESEDVGGGNQILYSNQPDLISPPPIPTVSGVIVAYLDVWQRHIDAIEDPLIREVALGGPDTATRAKTVWQVKILPVTSTVSDPINFDVEELPEWQALVAPSTGQLSAQAAQTTQPFDPCTIPQSAGFRRLENQLYRVEIHTAGDIEFDNTQTGPAPTFKWSRDNGSVSAPLLSTDAGAGTGTGTLTVQLQTTDEQRGFSPGQWVEVIDDKRDLNGDPGVLVNLAQADGGLLTYTTSTIQDPLGLVTPATGILLSQFFGTPRVRRWDMANGPITVVGNDGTQAAWIDLEDGVQVRFEFGTYKVGDYWEIPARTLPNLVEWPGGPANPQPRPPLGIRHHFTCLATYSMPGFLNARDCRKIFKPLTEIQGGGAAGDGPRPGQWRYYLIDGDAGSDATGRVGIDDNSANQALANALPFFSIHQALSSFARDGNDSNAIILLKTLPAQDNGQPGQYPDDISLSGIHGYRKILIRGSSFVTINQLPEQSIAGAISIAGFENGLVVTNTTGQGTNRLTFAEDIGVEPAQLGKRVRFAHDTTNPSLQDATAMVLRHGELTGGGSFVDIAPPLGRTSTIGGSDRLFIEFPGARVPNVSLSGTLPDNVLTMVGLFVANQLLVEGFGGSISFCQVGGAANVLNFSSLSVNEIFNDELGNQVGTGGGIVGVLGAQDGSNLFVSQSNLSQFNATRVKQVTVERSIVLQGGMENCGPSDIGENRSSPTGTLPFLTRLGASASVSFLETSGTVTGALLEGGGGDFANLFIQGHDQSLEIEDIDINANLRPSGIILDATQAQSCDIIYTPQQGFIPSGVFMLPQSTLIRPFELSVTDQYDAANNHYHASLLSFVNRGITLPKSSAENKPIQRYFVTQYDGTGGLGVKAAFAFDGQNGTRLDPSSIAGVAQQEIRISNTQPPNPGDGSSVHLTSGYSLVALAYFQRTNDASVTLPTPVFVSDVIYGAVTLDSELRDSSPRVRIGTLVKIITYADNINASQWVRFGLVRLQLDSPPPSLSAPTELAFAFGGQVNDQDVLPIDASGNDSSFMLLPWTFGAATSSSTGAGNATFRQLREFPVNGGPYRTLELSVRTDVLSLISNPSVTAPSITLRVTKNTPATQWTPTFISTVFLNVTAGDTPTSVTVPVDFKDGDTIGVVVQTAALQAGSNRWRGFVRVRLS
jgi:hypothetical protein